MTGIVWCNTFIEGIEQLEKIEESYKIIGIKMVKKEETINRCNIYFENGDQWKTVIPDENTRGYKCNISYISRTISPSIIQNIIYPATLDLPYNACYFYGKVLKED